MLLPITHTTVTETGHPGREPTTRMARDRHKQAALVRAIADGDSGDALQEFYESYSRIAMALLLRILGTRAEAEELLQEVFVELWRRAPQYDPSRASVSTWVTTIVRSRALDALRARKRRRGDHQVAPEDVSLPAPQGDQPDEQACSVPGIATPPQPDGGCSYLGAAAGSAREAGPPQ